MTQKPSWLPRLGLTLEHIGLALTIGGILALGAFVAPAVFRNFPIAEAGRVMTLIFRRYDIVLTISLGLILLGEVIQIIASGLGKRLSDGFRYVVLLLFTGVSIISLFTVHPQMEAYQKAGVMRGVGAEGQAFDQMHHASEQLYKAQLMLALGLLILVGMKPRAQMTIASHRDVALSS